MPKETKAEMVDENLPAKQGPNGLIEYAIYQNAPIETLKELMELQERDDANKARKAYHVAMAEFKADPPTIYKDGKVGYDTKKGGTTSYSHAKLDTAAKTINAALSKHDLNASWKTSQDSGQITVECVITHKLGHSESTSLSAGADSSGKKNPIQAMGSTVTYLQRYTLLALTGLAAEGQDDDGKGSETNSGIDKWVARLCEWTAVEGITAKELSKFWPDNEAAIRKDLPKDADSSKIYEAWQTAVRELEAKEGA